MQYQNLCFQPPSWMLQPLLTHSYPANIYLFKLNNRNTRKKCKICSKLIIKTPQGRRTISWVLQGEITELHPLKKFLKCRINGKIYRVHLKNFWSMQDTYIHYPAGIYLFKVNSGNARTVSEISSKITVKKTPKRRRLPVSLLIPLNRFNTLFWSFHY